MIKLRPIPTSLSPTSPEVMVATFFGSGRLRPASGTWGSLAALIVGVCIQNVFPSWIILPLAGLAYFLGIWASNKWLQASDDKDPQAIVIDEVAGLWLVLSVTPPTIFGYCAAFLAFRFFDVTKIWPANWADQKLTGPHAIMLDDVFAGLWASLVMLGLSWTNLL